MRIGFDMMAAQSPHHGGRGIGRYATSLVTTLLNRGDGHEYVLYVHDGLPSDIIPDSTRAEVRSLAFEIKVISPEGSFPAAIVKMSYPR